MVAAVLGMLVVAIVVGLAYLYSGEYNVAATDPHAGLVRWVLNTAQVQSVRSHTEETEILLPTDSSALRTGFIHFREMGVVCHGAPGESAGEIGLGLNPEPPDLSEVARSYSPEELYWILEHGIEMTGMPSLGAIHDREQILTITAFVSQ